MLEDIGALFITDGLGVDGFGDGMDGVPCPGKAVEAAGRLIPEREGVGVDGGFRALAGEGIGAGTGVAEGVGGADELVRGGEICGIDDEAAAATKTKGICIKYVPLFHYFLLNIYKMLGSLTCTTLRMDGSVKSYT